jgi:HEAT repeat protein
MYRGAMSVDLSNRLAKAVAECDRLGTTNEGAAEAVWQLASHRMVKNPQTGAIDDEGELARRLLAGLGVQAMPALARGTMYPNTLVRQRVLAPLGEIAIRGGKELLVLPLFERSAGDVDDVVRRSAAGCLAGLYRSLVLRGEADACASIISLLAKMLHDPDQTVRMATAEDLWRLGREDVLAPGKAWSDYGVNTNVTGGVRMRLPKNRDSK